MASIRDRTNVNKEQFKQLLQMLKCWFSFYRDRACAVDTSEPSLIEVFTADENVRNLMGNLLAMAPMTRHTKKKITNTKNIEKAKEMELKSENGERTSHDFSFLEVALNLNDTEMMTKSMTKSMAKSEAKSEANNVHQCNLCRYFCKDEAELTRHVKYHLKDKLLKCHICPFVCKAKSELEKHFVTHIVKRRYACPSCEYSTPRCDKLNRHLMIHSGEKPYKCDLCPYSGRDKDKLKRHNMIHTGEKPAKCPLCNYCGRDNDKVKRHLATHVRRIKE